jgi:hypothetical protein
MSVVVAQASGGSEPNLITRQDATNVGAGTLLITG